jgi:thioesterase domain-containing protein
VQPVYGVQADLAGDGPRPVTAGEVADQYLREVRAVQPHGPYRLLGWSYGGRIAHTMATRLQRDGEEVELLVLLDSHPVETLFSGTPVDARAADPALVAEFLRAVGLTDVPPGGIEAHRDPWDLLSAAEHHIAILRRDLCDALFQTFRGAITIGREPPEQRFRGELVLFTASREQLSAELSAAWQRYTDGPVTEYPLDCGHYEMTGPERLAEIAKVLEKLLRGGARIESVKCAAAEQKRQRDASPRMNLSLTCMTPESP